MAAMQGEISSSSLEHQPRWVSSGCPLAVLPAMAPVPSARHVLLCLCSPPFLPAMLPWPEETSVAGKGRARGAACSALHGCSCMAAACMLLAGGRTARVTRARWCWWPVLSTVGYICGEFMILCPALRAGQCQHPCPVGEKLEAAGTGNRGLAALLCPKHGTGRKSGSSFTQGREQLLGSVLSTPGPQGLSSLCCPALG